MLSIYQYPFKSFLSPCTNVNETTMKNMSKCHVNNWLFMRKTTGNQNIYSILKPVHRFELMPIWRQWIITTIDVYYDWMYYMYQYRVDKEAPLMRKLVWYCPSENLLYLQNISTIVPHQHITIVHTKWDNSAVYIAHIWAVILSKYITYRLCQNDSFYF